VDVETENRIANMLNCNVGRLPMKYLGFPISNKRLGVKAFKSVVDDETTTAALERETANIGGD
jgi:hypothetical protein